MWHGQSVMLSLDFPIPFFIYMRKHCSIWVIYSYSNKFIFCTIPFSFTELCKMSVLPSNNQAKQKFSISKPQIWLFDTLSTKKCSQVAWFHSTRIFQRLYFYFVLDCLVICFQCVILFMSVNIAYFMKRQTGTAIKELNGIP